MATVPTGRLERELRALYLRWVDGIADHADDLPSYIDQFQAESTELINRMGGQIARLGVQADFPAPRQLELSEVIGHAYDAMKQAAIKSGIATGLNARDIARAMLNSGLGKSYNQLERLARTEVVSAYWKNQWDQAEGLGLEMVWSSEHGPRTCEWCLAKDGMVVKDKTIRDHPNGRCTLRPRLPADLSRYKAPNPTVVSPVPRLETPRGITGWWLGQYGGGHAYLWNQLFRRGDLSAPWTDERTLARLNERTGSNVKNTLDSLAVTLANDAATVTRSGTAVWRGENSHEIWEGSPGDSVARTMLAPTSTSVDFKEAAGRLGDDGVLYALEMPSGSLVMPGQATEGELILVPGSRVMVKSDNMEDIEGVLTRVIRGIVLPPVVGDPYYSERTRRI
ncbi:head maturation protease [Microbacterium phage Pikmin]|uniref:Capsid maturation protease and MuF-like fusion protein n=3 Tax=Pikminvirus pikmin TaxID=2560596 RepID=A0A2P1CKG9_9CAUD|nr:head maturation protease [Microbacterium phage Pikmin]AVJ50995.1 capsid maturation protease and MuF-like fusion protein [Microbacterium phage Pajaza]AVJ51142.1 capsid maturation protease and MuF-like fusion protein [Microbacterium phage Pikmin]AVJ51700.1 capsid maturation protease and MuF-like fusion protein [Microbacterium phage Casey]